MTRTKWLLVALLAALAAAVAATVSPPTAAAAPCRPTATILADLGYGGSAVAIHGNTVVGLVNDASGDDLPAYWRNGQLSLIGGFAEGWASDINARGEIVGNGDFYSSPFAFTQGTVRPLAAPGGFNFASGVNDWGQIIGVVDNYAVRWDSSSGQPTNLLPAAGDSTSFAKGINDLGQVAGDTDDANLVPRAAVWNLAGQIRVLPSGLGAGQPSDLYDINLAGQSAGESYVGDAFGVSADQATRWSAGGVPRLIPFLPSANLSTGYGLNDLGWVGGIAFVNFDYSTGNSDDFHAFVWFGGGPSKTLPVPGYSYDDGESLVHYIADDGTAVGEAGPVGGPDAATVWTCAQAQAFVPGASAALLHRAAPLTDKRVTFRRMHDRRMP